MRPGQRTRNNAASVSLFPFLAVLLCTMGALIVVLVVLSQLAKANAREARDENAQAQLEQVAEQQAEVEKLTAQLAQLRQLKDSLADQLAAALQKSRDLAAEANRLRQAVSVTTQTSSSIADTARLDQQLENLKAQQMFLLEQEDELEQRLAKAKDKKDHPQKSFAIVPYRGPNETFRRPTYIECRSDGVVLHPSGIKLSAKDFPASLGPGNPLAAAMRVTAMHYQQAGEPNPPYPLLLVRPDGIMAYYAARTALQWWDSDVGYELIDGEWDLALPEEDQQLTQVQAQAVDASRRLQNDSAVAFHSLMDTQSGGGPETPRSYRVSRSLGGLVPEGGYTPGDYELPPRADMSASRYQPTDAADQNGYSAPGSESGSSGNSEFNGGRGGFAGSQQRGVPGNNDRYNLDRSASGGTGSNASASERYTGERYGSGNVGGTGTGTGRYGEGPDRTGTQSGTGSQRMSPQIGRYGSNPGGTEGLANSTGPYGPNGPNASGTNEPGGSNPSGNPGTFGQSASGQGQPNGQPGQNGQTSGGQFGGMQQYPSANSVAGSSSAGSPSSPGGTPGSGGGTPGSSSSSGPAQFGGQPESGGTASGSVADRRGKGWALRSIRGTSTTGVTRPIRIVCDVDRLIILSEDRVPRVEKIIDLTAYTEDSIDALQQAVTKRTQSWGMAGAGMYWHPILQMEVTPLGQRRFQDFEVLLANSGFHLQKKQISSASIGGSSSSPGMR